MEDTRKLTNKVRPIIHSVIVLMGNGRRMPHEEDRGFGKGLETIV